MEHGLDCPVVLENVRWLFLLKIYCRIVLTASCGAAPLITNGFVYSTNFTADLSEFGSYIRYRCRSGYKLMGLDISFCEANLQWSTLPTCEILFCPTPPQIPRAQLFNRTWPDSRRPQDGDRASYVCEPGYQVEAGTNTIVCLYDGSWTPEPNCVTNVPDSPVTCGAVPRVAFGSIQSASFAYDDGRSKSSIGDNIVYLCDPQFVLSGSANVRCLEDGTWTALPTCTCMFCIN